MSNWISIKEKLPPKDLVVLFYCKELTPSIFVGYLHPDYGYFSIAAEHGFMRGCEILFEVTHWMHCPEPAWMHC